MGFMDMTRECKVKEFRDAANKGDYDANPEEADMIISCIVEELSEFIDASADYEERQDDESRAQLCKEWADLQYVVSQAALYYGIPADPAFNRVHSSNMTKVIDGKCIFREDGKILKPEGYQPADMRGL